MNDIQKILSLTQNLFHSLYLTWKTSSGLVFRACIAMNSVLKCCYLKPFFIFRNMKKEPG